MTLLSSFASPLRLNSRKHKDSRDHSVFARLLTSSTGELSIYEEHKQFKYLAKLNTPYTYILL
jgi:hypothetical protein